MTNGLTNYGQRCAIYKDIKPVGGGADTNVSGIINVATRIRLYSSLSVPAKADASAVAAGPGFVEVAQAGGYLTGGLAIVPANWTMSLSGLNVQYQLADQIWTCAGGQIVNVAGAFITDALGNCLAWWERGSTVTLNPGETITADNLILRAGP